MKQLIFSAVVLAFLGGLSPALRAQSPCCEGHECTAQTSACCTESPCCKGHECAVSTDAAYAQELLNILQTTKSVDAFVVTLNLLADTEVEPHTAIPLIVRNAERVGIFGDSLQQDQEDADKPSALVIQVLGKLTEQMHAARTRKEAPKVSVPVQVMPAPVYWSVPPMPAPVCVPVGPIPLPTCVPVQLMPASICVPVEPIAAPKCESDPCNESKKEDKNDYRTPVIEPIHPASADTCYDPPEDAEILRALGKPCCEPCCAEKCGEDVEILKEHTVDHVDEPCFYPLVGPAQLHHSHWKCTVFSTEKLDTSFLIPVEITRPHVDVVYIDKDHLHLCPTCEKPTQQQLFSFWTGFFQ